MGDLRIEHDDQLSSGTCSHCGAPFESVIGVMYEDDDPIAIYRAGHLRSTFTASQSRASCCRSRVGDWSDGDRSC